MSRVLDDVLFPDQISRDITVVRAQNTSLIQTESGWEQSLSRRSESLVEMSVALSVFNAEKQTEILNFFEVVKGRHFGFRCRDWTDFIAGYSTYLIGGSVSPHIFATGNGSQTQFQLKKRYVVGSNTRERKISRPRQSSEKPLKIYLNGVEQTSGWSVNYATGIITFTSPPGNGIQIGWAGLFDLPMRFDTDRPGLRMIVNMIGSTDTLRLVQLKE